MRNKRYYHCLSILNNKNPRSRGAVIWNTKTCVRVQISRQSLAIWTQLEIDQLRNQADNASLRIPTDQVLKTGSRSHIEHNPPDFLDL